MTKLEVIHAHRFVFTRAMGARELSYLRMQADAAWQAGKYHLGRKLDFEVAMATMLAKRTNASRLQVASVNRATRETYAREMWYWQWRLWLAWVGGREIQFVMLEHKPHRPHMIVNPYALLYPQIATRKELDEMNRMDNERTITNEP